MKIRTQIPIFDGMVSYRDALTIHSIETIHDQGILDLTVNMMLFKFEGSWFAFDIAKYQLVQGQYRDIPYSRDFYGQECTLTYFYIQEMLYNEESIYFASAVFDIGEHLNYRIFRQHAYFTPNLRSLKKDPFWIS